MGRRTSILNNAKQSNSKIFWEFIAVDYVVIQFFLTLIILSWIWNDGIHLFFFFCIVVKTKLRKLYRLWFQSSLRLLSNMIMFTADYNFVHVDAWSFLFVLFGNNLDLFYRLDRKATFFSWHCSLVTVVNRTANQGRKEPHWARESFLSPVATHGHFLLVIKTY